MRRLLGLALCISFSAATGVSAAPDCSRLLSEGCACVASIGEAGDVVGQLNVAGGDVRKTGTGDYTPLAPHTIERLRVGDGVIIGDNGQAYLTAGLNCKDRKLDAQTSVVVGNVNGCACVAIVGSDATEPLETGSIGGSGNGAALATTIVVGGTGLFLLLKQSISP